jgi:hypothetical protein
VTALAPYARLIRMSDDGTRATTTNLLRGTGRSSRLDAAGGLTVAVPLSDAGDTSAADVAGGKLGFAATLLQAAGGPNGTATPVPMLLSLSLDGGANYDSHHLVLKPLRDMRPDGLTLTVDGDDIWSLYSMVPAGGGHVTMVGVSLADLLGKAPGAIIPLSGATGFISTANHLPFVCGLLYATASILQDVPGASSWDAGALARLPFVGVVATEGMTTPADLAFNLPVTTDSWADNVQHALAVIVEKLGGVVLSGDAAPLGSRGHYVADCSSAALNVSGTLAGVVANGAPSAGALGTLSSAAPVARAVVIGSTGSPSGLTFNGDLAADVVIDEATTARILSGVTIEPDLTVLHGQCSFEGGASDAGFPAGGTITALTQLNRGAGDFAWATCLPIVGINVSDQSGGVYLYDTLGKLVSLNKSQALPTLDMCVDTVNNVINIATPHGCYNRTTDVTDTSAAWAIIGGLTARVTRMSLVILGGVAYLYALVSDPQNAAMDGVYRYWPAHPSLITGAGYNGWVRLMSSSNVLDMQATDDHSFFYLDKSDQHNVFKHDYGASPATTVPFVLPSNVNAIRLDRVTGGTVDTVYAVTTGDTEAAYYTKFTTSWQPFVKAWLAVGAAGAVKVNRFYGPNAVVNSVNAVQVMAATDNGIYWSTTNTPTATGDWTSANDQNGLGGVSVTQVSVGAAQVLAGQTTSRLFAASDNALYMSGNSGLQFDNVTQGRVDGGPYFAALVKSATGGAYPTNKVQTVGPMASTPIGGPAGSHVQVTTYAGFPTLPATWYWQRRLTQRLSWEYRLVNPDCPFPHLQRDQLTDIEANESQTVDTASALVAAVARKWLGENSTAQSILHVPSSFTQTSAALRKLQPTQAVAVTLSGTIPQRSSTGDIIDALYVNFSGATFYVLDHAWHLAQDGGPYAETSTTLGSVLRTAPLSAADMAATFQRQLRDLKVFTTGRRRQ